MKRCTVEHLNFTS